MGSPVIEIEPPGFGVHGRHYHDFMAYGEGPFWTSDVSWRRLAYWFEDTIHVSGQGVRPVGARRIRPALSDLVMVTGVFHHGRCRILSAARGPARRERIGGRAAIRLEARYKGGRTEFGAAAIARLHDLEGSGVSAFAGTIPLERGRLVSVKVLGGRRGKCLVRRSAHPPVLRIRAPRPGSVLDRKNGTDVRWTLGDRDGGGVMVTASYRVGRHGWRLLGASEGRSGMRLPPASLPPGRNLAMRFVATDGLNSTARIIRGLVSR